MQDLLLKTGTQIGQHQLKNAKFNNYDVKSYLLWKETSLKVVLSKPQEQRSYINHIVETTTHKAVPT